VHLDFQGQVPPILDDVDPIVPTAEPVREAGAAPRVDAGQHPQRGGRQLPALGLVAPRLHVVRRQRHALGHGRAGTPPPLYAGVAHVHDHVRLHGAASLRSAASWATTCWTSFASPAPVTAETRSTSRRSSSSSRLRTSWLPVSSPLLTATTSGFSASSRPCIS